MTLCECKVIEPDFILNCPDETTDKIGLDLVSTIVVAVLIGLGIDKIFSTHPIFFIIFLLLGIISGFYSVIKSMSKLK